MQIDKRTTLRTMLFDCRATTRERKSLYFLVNLLRSVCNHDTSVAVARGHLAGVPLKRWKEFGVEKGGLGKTEFGGNITSKSKVWILINGAGDKTHSLFVFLVVSAKYVGKR